MGEYKEDMSLEINPDNLDKEMSEQAAKFCYIAMRAVDANTRYYDAKLRLEKTIAALDGEIRNEALATKTKLTEKAIEGKISMMPAYIEAQKALIEARAWRDRMKALKDAWHSRKDLMIQIAITRRAEMEALAAKVASYVDEV